MYACVDSWLANKKKEASHSHCYFSRHFRFKVCKYVYFFTITCVLLRKSMLNVSSLKNNGGDEPNRKSHVRYF